METKYAIIVAGGEGTRMGGVLPKQFQNLCSRPVAWWSLKAFHDQDESTRLILVVNPKFFALWEELVGNLAMEDRIEHCVVAGGSTRTQSVKNGLSQIEEPIGSLVAIHDAARPLIDVDTIERGWSEARKCGGAVPVVPVVDSLRKLVGEGDSMAVDRSKYVAVQTPQVFRTEELIEAYNANKEGTFTDDASAFELLGRIPSLFNGHSSNFKVTSPGDLERAEAILKEKNGFRRN